MLSPTKLDACTYAKACLLVVLQLMCCMQVLANSEDPASVLPREKRDAMITSPADFFGFRIGSRHLRHEQVCDYMKLLASETESYTASDLTLLLERVIHVTISRESYTLKDEDVCV